MANSSPEQPPADQNANLRSMLSESGYSDKAIDYYIRKPHMGIIENADQISEMTGTCGDSMKVYLKVEKGRIADVKYQILGCPGSISAAMAAVDLVRGQSIDEALALNDADVFKSLEDIPAKKHHCIQLAVKALQNAITEYRKHNRGRDLIAATVPAGPGMRKVGENPGEACCTGAGKPGDCGAAGGCCGKPL
jgi:nitrogen fixation NifU-like protein